MSRRRDRRRKERRREPEPPPMPSPSPAAIAATSAQVMRQAVTVDLRRDNPYFFHGDVLYVRTFGGPVASRSSPRRSGQSRRR